ncbi:DUF2939 domain-containing protein [Stenotrophomonas pavanii]|jgi:Protein of unknown function (DUF2939)|uniref:DUF2939 domain-containing protein n=1 Tax=Stenotrophomonas pavanii TaxID=487698 RepID=A0A246L1U2_9GAMM|nr:MULTISPECIES: DUF2939 domain-containing protein [Stenotrophomonas]MBC9079373.1 DUF2939 domain-containing protein [Stenotrophomonas maltophilia]KRG82821.1 hypothetical protein ABB31_00525 [Stenotrophomonas pavanii]MBC9091774.1 DUF2939 domain-containing protein [Stenotrophomonas maltophilia]MBH1520111.1 DUF2939 domain-containing protein [Stenotrophomonas maltophilia]MBN4942677.1 DUF2939 domain-containing protein [Stenotrophomonas maltophilia]
MKKLSALVVLLVLALAAWWFGGPYLTVNGLSKAIEQRDTARLERYVDFPRVRSSLRAQLNDYLVRQAGPEVAASPFGALLYGLGDQLGGAAVDTLVTPTGIGAMLQGHVLWKRGRNELQGGDAFGPTEPAQPLKQAEHHFESFDRFVIDVDRGPGQPPLKVVLEPQGLRWKVVDLQLGLSASP